MGAQFGEVGHRTTTILTSQFRQHPDHEQTRQGVVPTTSVSMISNGLPARRTAPPNQTPALSEEEKADAKVLYRS